MNGCSGQVVANKSNKEKMENTKENNPLLCDIETGMCETGPETSENKIDVENEGAKPVRVIYFTDPICSSCWGIEPQLRKLKLEYGYALDIDYRMGGLLPDWSYNSGGINKPSDVAHHWDEVSVYYDMPIDGDVWLEDPLNSSYPPSIAFKAAQMQDETKAVKFLRELRELVFLEKKNITKWKYVEQAAKTTGLDVERLKADYEGGQAERLFKEDLQLAREMGVRGFPTIFFIDEKNAVERVYGSKPYPVYEGSVLKLFQGEKQEYGKEWSDLFSIYPTLTAKEFSVLSGESRENAEIQLEKLVTQGKLSKFTTKNGNLYKVQ